MRKEQELTLEQQKLLNGYTNAEDKTDYMSRHREDFERCFNTPEEQRKMINALSGTVPGFRLPKGVINFFLGYVILICTSAFIYVSFVILSSSNLDILKTFFASLPFIIIFISLFINNKNLKKKRREEEHKKNSTYAGDFCSTHGFDEEDRTLKEIEEKRARVKNVPEGWD